MLSAYARSAKSSVTAAFIGYQPGPAGRNYIVTRAAGFPTNRGRSCTEFELFRFLQLVCSVDGVWFDKLLEWPLFTSCQAAIHEFAD